MKIKKIVQAFLFLLGFQPAALLASSSDSSYGYYIAKGSDSSYIPVPLRDVPKIKHNDKSSDNEALSNNLKGNEYSNPFLFPNNIYKYKPVPKSQLIKIEDPTTMDRSENHTGDNESIIGGISLGKKPRIYWDSGCVLKIKISTEMTSAKPLFMQFKGELNAQEGMFLIKTFFGKNKIETSKSHHLNLRNRWEVCWSKSWGFRMWRDSTTKNIDFLPIAKLDPLIHINKRMMYTVIGHIQRKENVIALLPWKITKLIQRYAVLNEYLFMLLLGQRVCHFNSRLEGINICSKERGESHFLQFGKFNKVSSGHSFEKLCELDSTLKGILPPMNLIIGVPLVFIKNYPPYSSICQRNTYTHFPLLHDKVSEAIKKFNTNNELKKTCKKEDFSRGGVNHDHHASDEEDREILQVCYAYSLVLNSFHLERFLFQEIYTSLVAQNYKNPTLSLKSKKSFKPSFFSLACSLLPF